jgi:hypothetical protein
LSTFPFSSSLSFKKNKYRFDVYFGVIKSGSGAYRAYITEVILCWPSRTNILGLKSSLTLENLSVLCIGLEAKGACPGIILRKRKEPMKYPFRIEASNSSISCLVQANFL